MKTDNGIITPAITPKIGINALVLSITISAFAMHSPQTKNVT
jgi:hypothetical protein